MHERGLRAIEPIFLAFILLLCFSRASLSPDKPRDSDSHKSEFLKNSESIVADIFGWCYIIAWSVSIYPQIWLNYKRKSVAGLSIDLVILNLLDFFNYFVFNYGLYFMARSSIGSSPNHDSLVNPIQINDLVYSTHAFFFINVVLAQMFYYEGREAVSGMTRLLVISCLLAQGSLALCAVFGAFSWLTFIYVIGYFKVLITPSKYVPQVWKNYKSKNAEGLSPYYVILDCTGGVLALLQQILQAIEQDNMWILKHNAVKLLLSCTSVFFDLILLTQRYIIYTKANTNGEKNKLLT